MKIPFRPGKRAFGNFLLGDVHAVACGLKMKGPRRPSQVLCEQVRTLEKSRLQAYLGEVSGGTLARVEQALHRALGTAR